MFSNTFFFHKRKYILLGQTKYLDRSNCSLQAYDPATDVFTCGCSVQKTGRSAWRNHLRKRTKIARRQARVDNILKLSEGPLLSTQAPHKIMPEKEKPLQMNGSESKNNCSSELQSA